MAIIRTVRGVDWDDASSVESIKCGEINSTVDRCMSELLQDGLDRGTGQSVVPWTGTREEALGAMWAGVPSISGAHKDSEGAWMIPSGASSSTLISAHPYYIRMSPAPPDAEVQYGFCTLRWDRFDEFVQKLLMVGGELPAIKHMPISSGGDASFRVDTMIIAALRVAHGRPGDRASDRFRELLGTMELNSFLVDMLRNCYRDSATGRNVLSDRDSRYIEMVGIVASEAYPGLQKITIKTRDRDLLRFREANLLQSRPWGRDCIWPILFNVVMPRSIFDAVDRCMEAGIPPIVPQYVTHQYHMFNGNWGDPCTGLSVSSEAGVSYRGQKILGGVTNTFNVDLRGNTSYWPFNMNPPQEWVDLFVSQSMKLGEEVQPVPQSDREDLSLLHARDIPVVMSVARGRSRPVLKYKRLIELERSGTLVVKVVTVECDALGE